MAVTITAAELAAAIRVGDSSEEQAEVARLLTVASTAVVRYAPLAPDDIHSESCIRLAGHWFDQPLAGRGAYADALRNSGAQALLLPYRVHRAGSTGEAADSDTSDASGTTPAPPEPPDRADLVIACGWSTDTTFTEAELSSRGMGTEVAVPTTTQGGYVGAWLANRGGVAPRIQSAVFVEGGQPIPTAFADGIAYNLDSMLGTLFVTGVAVSHLLGGTRLELTLIGE